MRQLQNNPPIDMTHFQGIYHAHKYEGICITYTLHNQYIVKFSSVNVTRHNFEMNLL